MFSINEKRYVFLEYGCIAHFSKNETATMSFLKKPSLVPRALFGCEVWNQLHSQDILILERMQYFCAKVIQDFNTRFRSDKAMTMLGLPRIVAV